MSPKRHTFPRSHRLSGRLQFARVFGFKCRASRGPLTLFIAPGDLDHPRLGLSVSGRLGTAVRRNRIKRLLRESFRLLQHEIPCAADLVVVARPHEPMPLEDYRRLLRDLIERGHRQLQKRQGSGGESGD